MIRHSEGCGDPGCVPCWWEAFDYEEYQAISLRAEFLTLIRGEADAEHRRQLALSTVNGARRQRGFVPVDAAAVARVDDLAAGHVGLCGEVRAVLR